jgi:methylated-DNA-[protein]-cysteine S-methyltransferase
MSPCQYIQSLYPSPVGVLRIIANNAGLIGILWDKEDGTRIKLPQLLACSGSNAHIHITRKWLDRYFSHASNQTVFPALPPLILSQFTALEKATILALNTIPFGTTLSYKDMAQKIGNPRAVRAVASAI